MSGLYVHVPFCKSVCGYCDFYKTTNLDLKNLYISSLLNELDSISIYLREFSIRTLYFGGGTPSLLQRNDFEMIFEKINSLIDLKCVEEITVEINPDDFTLLKGNELLQFPVNRLSFGIQSIYDDLLLMLNRRHSSDQIYKSLQLAFDLGFNNITVDLIYGLPGLDIDRWIKTVEKVVSLPVTHISAYHLSYEKGTSFYKDLKNGTKREMSDNDSLLQYQLLCDILKSNGFVDYEISNFCRPGYESKHNSLYWTGSPYFGVGPSSHSFYEGVRRWNCSDLNRYVKNLGVNCFVEDVLTELDFYNECIMLGLRQRNGIDLSRLKSYGDYYLKYFVPVSREFLNNGDFEIVNGCCRVSDKSRFITDFFVQKLFVVE